MLITDFFSQELDSYITSRTIHYDIPSVPEGIIFLEGMDASAKNHIYIGSVSQVLEAMYSESIAKPATFFVSKDLEKRSVSVPAGYNVFETNLDIFRLYNILHNTIRKCAELDYQNSDFSFANFLHDTVSMQIADRDELLRRTMGLRFPITGKRFHLILINSTAAGSEKMIAELKEIFPKCNIALYENRIVIIYPNDNEENIFPDDVRTALVDFLDKYETVAAMTSGVRKLERLRTIYYIAENLLKMGMAMIDPQINGRLYHTVDFCTFNILDLCFREFERTFHNNDIIYFTHPALIVLLRYDREHNTNLYEILRTYVRNNNNLARTSDAMFMHRNTTLNKIHKIAELTHLDLSEEQTCFNVALSYHILDYYQMYLGFELQL